MKNFTKILLFLSITLVSSIGAFAQMSGTYTVSATGSANFSSMLAANAALSQNGVSGPVIINIKDGTYPRFSVDSIAGTSAINTVTFQSDPSNTQPSGN